MEGARGKGGRSESPPGRGVGNTGAVRSLPPRRGRAGVAGWPWMGICRGPARCARFGIRLCVVTRDANTQCQSTGILSVCGSCTQCSSVSSYSYHDLDLASHYWSQRGAAWGLWSMAAVAPCSRLYL